MGCAVPMMHAPPPVNPFLESVALLGVPLAAYNVSGEYSMALAAAERGWLDERAVALETLTAIARAGAGAGIIITYWAKQAARWLLEPST